MATDPETRPALGATVRRYARQGFWLCGTWLAMDMVAAVAGRGVALAMAGVAFVGCILFLYILGRRAREVAHG